jgi:hypothetical protein
VRIALVVGCSAALVLGACGSGTTVTTGPPTSTTRPCAATTPPATPVTGPAQTAASLLTNVHQVSDTCVDDVIFDFTATGTNPPGYSLTYGTPPFVDNGSGAPVTVAGKAFVVVTVKPGYGYDYVGGKATYTGPKSLPIAHANHVTAIVETGDFEGVLTWVIGLDAKRPFRVQATGTPRHQLVVTVS